MSQEHSNMTYSHAIVLRAMINQLSKSSGEKVVLDLYAEACNLVATLSENVSINDIQIDVNSYFSGLIPDEQLINLGD